jgi:hypothetical protein
VLNMELYEALRSYDFREVLAGAFGFGLGVAHATYHRVRKEHLQSRLTGAAIVSFGASGFGGASFGRNMTSAISGALGYEAGYAVTAKSFKIAERASEDIRHSKQKREELKLLTGILQ